MKPSNGTTLFDQAISTALSELRPIKEPLKESTVSFFNTYDIGDNLKQFLERYSFDRPLKVGHVYFDRVNSIPQNCLEQENINCIKEGLLQIGCGLNGDPIVVDTKNLSVGYIFHDELWEDQSIKARDVYVNLGMGIGEFYYNSTTKMDTFPVDAYEAEEFLKSNDGM